MDLESLQAKLSASLQQQRQLISTEWLKDFKEQPQDRSIADELARSGTISRPHRLGLGAKPSKQAQLQDDIQKAKFDYMQSKNNINNADSGKESSKLDRKLKRVKYQQTLAKLQQSKRPAPDEQQQNPSDSDSERKQSSSKKLKHSNDFMSQYLSKKKRKQ